MSTRIKLERETFIVAAVIIKVFFYSRQATDQSAGKLFMEQPETGLRKKYSGHCGMDNYHGGFEKKYVY